MRARIDLTGQQFGRWTVLSETVPADKWGNARWRCKCLCGVVRTVLSHSLRSGSTQSCGCFMKERVAATNRTHGHTSRGKPSPTWNSWASMIQRCINANAPNFPQYGGAGVTVCPEWVTFDGFLKSMGVRPANTTLGRILDTGDYVVGNAFWQTDVEQKLAQRNKQALLTFAARAA